MILYAILLCATIVIVALLLWYCKRRLRQSEQALLHQLMKLHDIPVRAQITVLRIDYAHPSFKTIEEWLAARVSQPDQSLIILLTAPEWLCGIKSKNWGTKAAVLPVSQCHPAWDTLVRSGYAVAEWSHNRVRRFTDQQLYMNHSMPYPPLSKQEVIES